MLLPEAFTRLMQQQFEPEELKSFLHTLARTQPVTSFRLNTAKPCPPPFSDSGHALSQVPWCPSGQYIEPRPAFIQDPLLHAGTYYVQEASSMFLDHVLRTLFADTSQPLVGLDLCAAPGGKSTLTLNTLPAGSLLVANEIVRQRANILAENLTKWGYPAIIVTSNPPSAFSPLPLRFDFVLCDAPCSGEGMFRKEPQAVEEWSTANVDMCSRRQRDIVGDVWPCLKPGGYLIYSTCTYNTLENEQNVLWMARELGADIIDCQPDEHWNITGNLLPHHSFPCYHFFPHKTRGEGFFLAVLRKHDSTGTAVTPHRNRKADKAKRHTSNTATPRELNTWLRQAEDFTISYDERQQIFTAFPTPHTEILATLRQHLNILHHGIPMAAMKGGKKLQPLHALAMCNKLDNRAFSTREVSKEEALAYLRTESLTLPSDTPRGYVLLTHQGQPLGFVNNLGSRANNLYPQPWRIRTTH